MLVRTISPAPSRSTSRAQLTASSPVETRPPLMCTSHTRRPPRSTRLGSMLTTMHWLPKRRAACRTSSGSRTAAELIETLSAPALKSVRMSSRLANPPAHCQRHETHLGRAPYDLEQDRPAFVTRCDVQENQFIGTLQIITRRHGNRVARVLQVDEVRPFDHTAMIDVEARDDPLGQHALPQPDVPPAVAPADTTFVLPRRIPIPRSALYSIEETCAILEAGKRIVQSPVIHGRSKWSFRARSTSSDRGPYHVDPSGRPRSKSAPRAPAPAAQFQ